MKRARRKNSNPSPAVEPITWHRGWAKIGSPAGGHPTKAGGHRTDLYREDQPRFGVEHRVHLSSESPMLMSDGSTEQQYLNTYLMRLADDTAPRVFIGYNEAPGRPATLDEAWRFALEILALVDGLEA